MGIDQLTPEEMRSLLTEIADHLGIGANVRTPTTILTCVANITRRSDCLSQVERFCTRTVIDEEGEEVTESLLNWGEAPEAYMETFKRVVVLRADSELLSHGFTEKNPNRRL